MPGSARHTITATARVALETLRRAARSIARGARTVAAGAAAALTLASAGCGGYEDDGNRRVAATAATTAPRKDTKPAQPKLLGRFRMTFYYVVGEEEVPAPKPALVASTDHDGGPTDPTMPEEASDVPSDEALLAATAPPEKITIYDRSCRELAQVTPHFLAQLNMQGTGKLRDGRTINIGKACDCPKSPCYREVTGQRWGFAGNGRPLQAFRTVAVDPRKIKLGSLLYIPELDGRTMPGRAPWGGFVHDGCVVGDDTGGGVQGHQLDLFVGRRAYYKALGKRGGSHAWAKRVTVYDGRDRCQRTGGKVSKSQRGAI